MDRDTARQIVGNQDIICIRNMYKALQLHSWQNTGEEWIRRAAARVMLRKASELKPSRQHWINVICFEAIEDTTRPELKEFKKGKLYTARYWKESIKGSPYIQVCLTPPKEDGSFESFVLKRDRFERHFGEV